MLFHILERRNRLSFNFSKLDTSDNGLISRFGARGSGPRHSARSGRFGGPDCLIGAAAGLFGRGAGFGFRPCRGQAGRFDAFVVGHCERGRRLGAGHPDRPDPQPHADHLPVGEDVLHLRPDRDLRPLARSAARGAAPRLPAVDAARRAVRLEPASFRLER